MKNDAQDIRIGDEVTYAGTVLAISKSGEVAVSLPFRSRKQDFFTVSKAAVKPRERKWPMTEFKPGMVIRLPFYGALAHRGDWRVHEVSEGCLSAHALDANGAPFGSKVTVEFSEAVLVGLEDF
jgi:hypothetical protein